MPNFFKIGIDLATYRTFRYPRRRRCLGTDIAHFTLPSVAALRRAALFSLLLSSPLIFIYIFIFFLPFSLSLPAFLLCRSVSTFIGSALIFATSVIYGVQVLGKK